jgi:hypothetical protein
LGRQIFTNSGRKTLSRSHNDLNTTDDNIGLTENFSTYTELLNACENLNFLKISFDFYLFILTVLAQTMCNKSMNMAGILYII